ncbi:MAG: ABC transporter ATP-binding protein [Actinobacteria bacterium HGW-Actinobacteria-7]|jgi:branched-chain amino acid transport system ATP-binding protein|nr:MAG: ABC transporter ATP-binding protein [Actinobacteria bacterium HGW-Actinobacteria-7]
MLTVKDLYASYGAINALHGISLEVNEGELVALLGTNGAGKSTTLKSICGVLRPQGGSVEFLGEDLIGKKPEAILKKGISLVPEGREIFTSLSVAENLRIGAFSCYERDRYRYDLEEMFALFPILEERLQQPGGLLSGGEQQMLAIARALMSHPKLLMLDEPSLGLSPTMVDQIFDLIATLRDRGTTILLVEQNAERALRVADRAYVLKTGSMEFSGTPAELESELDIASVYFGGTKDGSGEVTV